MQHNPARWRRWREFFALRSRRPVPVAESAARYALLPSSLASSLAIFQLGESGGGTVVRQAERSRLPGVDADYAEAMRLFVAEEHRHADILATCVVSLGGELIYENWTAQTFVSIRRLMGLRLKVLVLLAAEVIGICYYYLLASRLPRCQIRQVLTEIVADEQSHLRFHCEFLRSQTHSRWRRLVFLAVWRTTMAAAAVAVLIDHRATLRDFGIGVRVVLRRWLDHSRLAERLVTGSATPGRTCEKARGIRR